MKNILYLLLFIPFTFFGQEEDPCYSINEVFSQMDVENPSITNNFVAGWNMFGYPCLQSVDLAEAFSSIVDKIVIVKNNSGAVYIPEWGFNGIGFLQGGDGYQIKMSDTEYGFSFCESISLPVIEGCTDCQAFNFNKLATINNNSCTYDTDGDGVIDENEISGCQDNNSCNYNASATEEGECTYPQDGYDCQGNWQQLNIGDLLYGGVIFWVDETFDRGLVASLEDLEPSAWGGECNDGIQNCWYQGNSSPTECTELDFIGSGLQNTIDVAELVDSNCDYSNSPLSIAYNLVYNGYDDWFIPSKDELFEMYINIGQGAINLGGLSGGYWSSTSPTNSSQASGFNFNYGNEGYFPLSGLSIYGYKENINNIRPIRAVGNWIEGCTNPYACNFNSEVNLVNNSLCEISPSFDGISMFDCDSIPICYDENACNYYTVDYSLYSDQYSNFSACEYPELGYDCDGNIFPYYIGQEAFGGIVFYIDETGEHGLVAGLEDLGSFEWGCFGTSISGAVDTVIGTGLQNTLEIVAGCSETPIAASEALSYEAEGYSDWYLPSKHELLEMYNTIGNGSPEGNIGGFSNNWYWSSSEDYNYPAWVVYFGSGYASSSYKTNPTRVRVIRAF